MKKNISRREFLKMTAKGILGSVAITACGDVLSTTAFAKQKQGEIKVGDSNYITDVDNLKQTKFVNFELRGIRSILLYNNGDIKAFENICTHKKGPTKLTGKVLTCIWHHSTFDPITGEALSVPAPKGSKLPAIKLDIKDGKIYAA